MRLSYGEIDDLNISGHPPSVDLEALANGSIDLTAIAEPWVTRLVESGQGVIWRPAQAIIPDFQWSYVLYGPNLLQANGDVGRRFMVAYLKAVRQFNRGGTDRNVEILSRHTGLDPELLKRACWPVFREDGSINALSFLDFQAWALASGMIDREVTVEQACNTTFVAQALRTMESRTP